VNKGNTGLEIVVLEGEELLIQLIVEDKIDLEGKHRVPEV
jgi:hypothetical protein